MVLLGLLLAAVAIALGVGLALQPGGELTNIHFFGLNLPNLNSRTLVLIGIVIGILFMLGVSLIRAGFAAAARRRRERKAEKAAFSESQRDAVSAREQEAKAREEADQREAEREAARRQEEAASWERAEAARREEAARMEEAALRQRTEPRPEPVHYPADPYPTDPYPPATSGHRAPEPYRGDSHPTDQFPTVDPATEQYPTVDPYGDRNDPHRPAGTVYGRGQYGAPPPSYPPSHQ
jgi:FtsZ-interacting cell division protein ZipA